MTYDVIFMPKAQKDMDSFSPDISRRMLLKVHAMRDDLAGDVRRLINMTPSYRLRVGDYRVLFEIENQNVIVHRVLHRREAYSG
jgi:mRNA interferase RelE/StbE